MNTNRSLWRKILLMAAVFSFLALPNLLAPGKAGEAFALPPNCCNDPYFECLPLTTCSFDCECKCDLNLYPECCEVYPMLCKGQKTK